MERDRAELKRKVLRQHSIYDTGLKRSAVRCAWCNEEITGECDLHEYLVKRSAVQPDRQHLIMVPENCAPVHHGCHMAHGQEREMARRCLYAVARSWSAQAIGQWYVSLWGTHGLTVNKGLLIPRKQVTIGSALDHFRLGCEFLHVSLDETRPDYDDAAGAAIKRWRGYNVDMPQYYQSVSFPLLVQAVDEGYWLSYLLGIIGLAQED